MATVYLPNGGFSFTWSYIHAFRAYCPAHYLVSVVTPGLWRFDDPFSPGSPGFVRSPILVAPWNSNHYTVDHIIAETWYEDSFGTHYFWDAWESKLEFDGLLSRYVVSIAVYSYDQLFYSRLTPPPPAGYWLPAT